MATAAFPHRGAPRRGAFTLLELLIAMALTLLLVYALAEFYSYVGDTVRDGRAIIEMGSNLRNAVRQLRDDLNAVTVRPIPPVDDNGMLEIIEGAANDIDVNADGTPDATIAGGTMMGDLDDVLTMTIRSGAVPFVGHYQYFDQNNGQFQQRNIESNLAEVVWFTTFKDVNGNGAYDPDEPRLLVRRMFLIVPNILGWRDSNGTDHYGELVDPTANPMPDNVFQHDDVSLAAPTFNNALNRWVWKANSLSTLTRRENRFIHLDLDLSNGSQNGLLAGNNYLPVPMQINLVNSASLAAYTLQGNATGEDLILPNMLAFDVRVYDPQAPLLGDEANANNIQAALQPGDPGYIDAIINNHLPVGYGAYVDLWYNRGLAQRLNSANRPVAFWPNSVFSWAPDARSLPPAYRQQVVSNPPIPFLDVNGRPMICSWDSWTNYYEHDGYDQNGQYGADEGADGIDNDNANGVDDPGELETHPPYPVWVGNNLVDDDLDGQIDEISNPPQATDERAVANPNPPAALRGIQVRVRMYEPGTRQTRQATVVADFLSE